MHITFDTLEMVRRLESKGFKREQAEEVISVVKDVQSELATKQDIENLQKATKQDIEALRKETKQDIEVLRKDIEDLQKETKQDIEVLRKETKQDIEKLRSDISKDMIVLKNDIIIKISGVMFALLITFKMFDKFF